VVVKFFGKNLGKWGDVFRIGQAEKPKKAPTPTILLVSAYLFGCMARLVSASFAMGMLVSAHIHTDCLLHLLTHCYTFLFAFKWWYAIVQLWQASSPPCSEPKHL